MTVSTHPSRFTFQTSIYFVAHFFSRALNYLVVLVFGWLLPVDEFGKFSLFQAIFGFLLAIGNLGFYDAATMIHFKIPEDSRNAGYRFLLIRQVVGAGILFGFFFLLAYSFGIWPPTDNPKIVFLGICFMTWLFFFTEWPINFHSLQQDAAKSVYWDLGRSFAGSLISILLIWFYSPTFSSFLIGQIIGFIPVTLAAANFFRLLDFSASRLPSLDRSWHLAVSMIPHNVFLWAILLSDRLILKRTASLEEIALFGMARQWGLIMLVSLVAMNKALSPAFLKHGKDGPIPESLKNLEIIFVYLFLSLGTVLVLVEPLFVRWLLPAHFLPALPAMGIITVAQTFDGFYFLFLNRIIAAQKAFLLAIISGFSGFLSIGLNIFLTPYYGSVGAATVALIIAVFKVLLAALISRKVGGACLPWEEIFPYCIFVFFVWIFFVPTFGLIASDNLGRLMTVLFITVLGIRKIFHVRVSAKNM